MINSKLISYHKILPVGEFFTLNEVSREMRVISTKQTHSCNIVEYSGRDLNNIEADGILINTKDFSNDFYIAIKTADCMPIIILGKEQIISIHAGWKGLADGILKNSLIKSIKPYYAFIGPSIQKDSFEVSDDFHQNFLNNSNFYQVGNKLYFDLQKEAQDQLYQLYDGIKVEQSKKDTLQEKQFFSYRRDKTHLRNWNLFTL